MRKILTITIFSIVFIIGLIFSAKNTHEVVINYYLGSVSMPLSVVIIASIVIGLFLGAVIMSMSGLRKRYEINQLQKKLNISEQELNSLRILPIKDEH